MEPKLCLLLLTILFVIVQVNSLPYDVHWLSGPISIEREIHPSKQTVDIYCYSGTPKNLFALWQTVKFNIKIKNDEFSQYLGNDPEQVYKEYMEDSNGWPIMNPFQKKSYRTVSLDLFTPTCMAVNTKEKHTIEIHVQRVDLWRVLMTAAGLALLLAAPALGRNPVFFYLCGVLVGVCASFMVLVYYFSKLLPRKTLTYGVLIGGWTVGVYLAQQAWENVRRLAAAHCAYVAWYTLATGCASFVLCYRVGPPRDRRTQNLVVWTLQLAGALATVFSSEYREASTAVAIAALAVVYFPRSVLRAAQGYWYRRFPPAPRPLSSSQYYEQGARETRRALDELRRHCASADCAQWAVMLKLSDAKRFASFVEGDSHLSDDEVMDYESYAFSLQRAKPTAHSTGNRLDISDDDSDDDDDD